MSRKSDPKRDPVSDDESGEDGSGSADLLGKTADKSLDNDDDEFEFEQFTEKKKPGTLGGEPEAAGTAGRKAGAVSAASAGTTATKVSDRPYDEAVEVSDSNEDSVASPTASPLPNKKQQQEQQKKLKQQRIGKKVEESEAEESHDVDDEEDQSNDSHVAAVAGAGAAPIRSSVQPKPKRANDTRIPTEQSESESEEEAGTDDAPPAIGNTAGGAEAKPSQAKLYNPADFAHLGVTPEIQSLFDYIARYKPSDIELDTKMKPFIPDYIPAVGEIDAFLKITPPQDANIGTIDQLGLTVLDEPAAHQSDPTVLDLQLRVVSKQVNLAPVTVRSIEGADKNPKKISKWIASIEEVHRQKPPQQVEYGQRMPEIEELMQAWSTEFEELLKGTALPTAELDLSVQEFANMVCAIMDIPVYEKTTESLHVLFTLYSEFKNNSHFQH